jgi:hypothetical protein
MTKKIYHLHIKKSDTKKSKDLYYSSLPAIFKKHPAEELGVSLSTLEKYDLENYDYKGRRFILSKVEFTPLPNIGFIGTRPRKLLRPLVQLQK